MNEHPHHDDSTRDDSVGDDSPDELAPVFERVTPRPAPPELRERVLAAVAHELTPTPDSLARGASEGGSANSSAPSLALRASNDTLRRVKPRWERICEWSVAASLLVGVGLQTWRWQAERDFPLRVYGPRPTTSGVAEIAAAVESVTDRQTARQLSERLQAARRSGSDADKSGQAYRRILEQLTHDPGKAKI